MKCQHCSASNPDGGHFRAIEGGRGYVQRCTFCNHVIDMRPHRPNDPPLEPTGLTPAEVARLRFVQWLLIAECIAQTDPAQRSRPVS